MLWTGFGVGGRKGHSAKLCANVVTVYACEAATSDSDGDKVISGEEQDAFVCDEPGKGFDKSGKMSCSALAWQIRDLPVFRDSGASCHMTHSSTGMVTYRKGNATIRTASGTRYTIEGYGDLSLAF